MLFQILLYGLAEDVTWSITCLFPEHYAAEALFHCVAVFYCKRTWGFIAEYKLSFRICQVWCLCRLIPLFCERAQVCRHPAVTCRCLELIVAPPVERHSKNQFVRRNPCRQMRLNRWGCGKVCGIFWFVQSGVNFCDVDIISNILGTRILQNQNPAFLRDMIL